MTNLQSHEYWMSQALQLARRGLFSTAPNPRVGCVVVQENQLISEGWHEFAGGPHAEINAINKTSIKPGCDFYITLEPCSHQGKTPPCVDALIKLQPRRVIIGMQDPNPLVAGQGIGKLRQEGIEVISNVLEAQVHELNSGFISRFEKKRPFVRLKMASSLDGRTALKNGKSQWITGESARQDVQYYRARASAILSSAATVLADDPSLNVRLSQNDLDQQCGVRQPARVIIDSQLRLTGNEKIFNCDGDVWVYTLNADEEKHRLLREAGADVTLLKSENKQLDLKQLLIHLASREINEIHTECGQSLAGALLRYGLVDEILLYMAPTLLGNQARGLFDLGELTEMNSRLRCKINQIRTIGDDIRITLTPEFS